MICLCTVQAAAAGAWLRDKGKGFTSIGATIRKTPGYYDYETTAYSEHGLAPKLTIGLDVNQTPGLTGHALAFARVPLIGHPDTSRLALEIGIGAHQLIGAWYPMQKLTLSYGRGFDGPWGPGWYNLDLATERRKGLQHSILKLDATIGLSGQARVQPLLQIETARIADLPLLWSLTPAIRIRDDNQRNWLIGVEYRSADIRTTGLKFAIWREF